MTGFVLVMMVIALVGVTLWLNVKFNEREKALQTQEQQLNQREMSLKQEQARHQANLNERLINAQAQGLALKKRQAELEGFAKWLKEQDAVMRKKYDGIKTQAKTDVETARKERDDARQRANRLQEKLNALEGKPKKFKNSQQDPSIQSVAT